MDIRYFPVNTGFSGTLTWVDTGEIPPPDAAVASSISSEVV